MAAPREYELVLMLDPQLDGPARDALAQEARGQIEGSGALKHENSWGLRKMAYEINRRTEADYRWMRFEANNELLDSLDHNLKIADGVLRFRIFKVDPSAPVVVPPSTTATPGPRERSQGGPREEGGDAPEETVSEPQEPTSEPQVAPSEPEESAGDAQPTDAEPVSAPAPAAAEAPSAPEAPADTDE